MRPLENPYLLKDLDKNLDLFLLELNNLEPLVPAKTESAQASSTLFGDTFNPTEGNHQTTITTSEIMEEEEDLPTKTPMATYRIMSPSPQPLRLELWDPCPESLRETELRPTPFSPNSWDT
jgi:hypothetical protein